MLLFPLAASADCAQGTICSALGDINLSRFLELILRAFVLFSIPVLTFVIIYAGFKFILARGRPEELAIAKWNFGFVIIGTCLVLGAWVFANLIGATLNSISSG